MIQEILETLELSGFHFFATTECVFCAVELEIVDAEITDLAAVDEAVAHFLKTLSESMTARFWQSSYASFEVSDSCFSRKNAIEKLGFVENKLVLVLEMGISKLSTFKNLFRSQMKSPILLEALAEKLRASFDLTPLKSADIKTKSLNRIAVDQLLISSTSGYLKKLSYGVDTGRYIYGLIRLVKQGTNPLSLLTYTYLKDSLPLPYEVRISVRRLSQEKSEMLLRRKSNQSANGSDRISAQKFQDSESQLEEVALFGGQIFKFEFLVLIPRGSEETVRMDADLIVQKLRALGDFAFETFGSAESFLSSQIGFNQHVTLLETDRILPSFLPICTLGSSDRFRKQTTKRELILQRRDQSLLGFDVFNPLYDNYSVNIIGKSGRGKSVLTNLLTRALHFDDQVSIIKVDVGGSHSKETKLLGGIEKSLTLNLPSGINPFAGLKNTEHSEDLCNVLASFLNVLLIEEGETYLSKAMKGEIERCVSSYSSTHPVNPSIQGFFDFAKDLPRRDLLARWTNSGVYRNAFREIENSNQFASTENRLKYFNFSQIFQANDPDFGQGGLAAVMAQFNLDMMKSKNQKLVFIADETPFFIERCFSFFKFSTANVRKFGGSFITVAQKSSDLVIQGDYGILENSAQKLLFSIDGDRESFAKRLKLEEKDLLKLEDLKSLKGQFSEVLLQDVMGARILRIELSKLEYWASTSSQDDNRKLESLLKAVPGLTLDQAIDALSQERLS